MKVEFASTKMQKLLSSEKEIVKKWGTPVGKKIQQRMQQLEAVGTLADITYLPGTRCHELVGDLKGSLAIDLAQPYRLIFRPSAQPPPQKNEGGLDWKAVSSVTIEDVIDYH